MYKIQGYTPGENKMKYEQISKSNTLLARLRNLLEEREIPIPPDIEEEIDEQLEQYAKYLEIKIQGELKQKRDDLEHIERAIELAEQQSDIEDTLKNLRKIKASILKEIEYLEALEAEEVLADPDWT